MRFRPALFLLPCLLFVNIAAAQEPPPRRDPRAVAALQQSVAVMGGAVPADSVATGTVTLVAGSKTESGNLRILTRGADQTVESLSIPERTRTLVYSRGLAREAGDTELLSMELTVTSQSPHFPLLILAAALGNPGTAFQYVGLETLDGATVHHIRFWDTFASRPKLQHLAEFSMKDIWIDAATGLPRKLSYQRRAARGAEPAIPLDVFYFAYRNVGGGVLYPFRILKSLNGTPWATITIGSVAINGGLTDRDFSLQ